MELLTLGNLKSVLIMVIDNIKGTMKKIFYKKTQIDFYTKVSIDTPSKLTFVYENKFI
ncbi:hypothetical protein CLORY_12340 [Clostridium oryzae]|uniref:Uncharacterized protein n=1 Tax=Clostridium oryzae TaxID=1450648 RepID=A0A1V4IVL1_9CLOT|nr:hypothetical protein CLORY_12340 [Clostridium oryzae]